MTDKKKILALIGAAALTLSLAACQNGTAADSGETGAAAEENQAAGQERSGETDTASGDTAPDDAASADTPQGGETSQGQTDTLVAYFSYSGNTEEIAQQIAGYTGADLVEIERATSYESASEEGEEELNSNARPEITVDLNSVEPYDTIFVGYPNWWGDMPQALYSFFDEYDFGGKTIIPFNSHNGSRFSNTIATIQELEPDARVVEDGFTVNERDVPDAAEDIAEWVAGLGY